MDREAIGAVFLSASVPDPLRGAHYADTADVSAIRDAVLALAEVVLQSGHLVFGGHPAISPLIVRAADRLGRRDGVRIFQSELFRAVVPADSLAFPSIEWTPGVDGDRAKSLLRMRERMLTSERFSAGVFIGGMEGVEDEFALFRCLHADLPAYPVPSTGGAALLLWQAHAQPHDDVQAQLRDELIYDALFRSLPGVFSQ